MINRSKYSKKNAVDLKFFQESDERFDVTKIDKSLIPVSTENATVGDFRIDTSSPLSAYSNEFVDAYSATSNLIQARDLVEPGTLTDDVADTNISYYALVFKNSYPIRFNEIISIKAIDNLTTPVAYGITQISAQDDSACFAVILTKPKGKSLRSLLNSGIRFDERYIYNDFLMPLIEILNRLHKHSIVYGKLNIDNIYIDSNGQVSLDEFISEPCGFSQIPFFETTERAQAHPYGKGMGNEKVDYYALGITIFWMASGKDFSRHETESFIKERLKEGTFSFLNNISSIPIRLTMFISYLVIDNTVQRWGYAEIEKHISSTASNISTLYDKTYAARAIAFNGQEFYSRKALAFELWQNWELACEFIKNDKIRKWLMSSSTEQEALELIDSFNSHMTTTKISAQKSSSSDERLVRLLVVLDPEGPIRTKDLAFFKDGIGLLLLEFYNSKQDSTTQSLLNLIVFNIFSIYDYISSITNSKFNSEVDDALYKSIDYVQRVGIEFGIDRCIYELNPTLICQYPPLKKRFCLDLADVLNYLNDNSISFEEVVSKKSLTCFIASRIKNTEDFRVKELEHYIVIQKSKIYQFCNMLAIAQKQSRISRLDNLASIVKGELIGMLNSYLKSNTIKSQMVSNIESAAESGAITEVVKAAISPKFFIKDREDYSQALKRGVDIVNEIKKYNKKDFRNRDSISKSLKIAVQFSYAVCCIITLIIIFDSLYP